METLMGWGLLAGLVVFLAAVIKFAGPPGESKPHCCVQKAPDRSSRPD